MTELVSGFNNLTHIGEGATIQAFPSQTDGAVVLKPVQLGPKGVADLNLRRKGMAIAAEVGQDISSGDVALRIPRLLNSTEEQLTVERVFGQSISNAELRISLGDNLAAFLNFRMGPQFRTNALICVLKLLQRIQQRSPPTNFMDLKSSPFWWNINPSSGRKELILLDQSIVEPASAEVKQVRGVVTTLDVGQFALSFLGGQRMFDFGQKRSLDNLVKKFTEEELAKPNGYQRAIEATESFRTGLDEEEILWSSQAREFWDRLTLAEKLYGRSLLDTKSILPEELQGVRQKLYIQLSRFKEFSSPAEALEEDILKWGSKEIGRKLELAITRTDINSPPSRDGNVRYVSFQNLLFVSFNDRLKVALGLSNSDLVSGNGSISIHLSLSGQPDYIQLPGGLFKPLKQVPELYEYLSNILVNKFNLLPEQ